MPGTPRRRVALYSHDTQGLGHVRRNIEIAAALVAAHPATDVLLLTGTPAAAALPLPAGTELVVLPGIAKDADGGYGSASLGLRLDDLLELRSRMLESAVTAFAPDLLVIDKVARGLGGELERALRAARTLRSPRGVATRVVLGLRDILDEPGTARREWRSARTDEAIAELYDEVWVYGDRRVHDLAAACALPAEIAARLRYTGYLAHGRGAGLRHAPAPDADRGARPFVLALVGGGQDGHCLAESVALAPRPADHRAIVVAGPCMPARQQQRLQRLAGDDPDLEVRAFVADPSALVRRASAVVSMGGYNTVCELLAARRPTLIVPRVRPRREQALRARLLAARSGLDHLEPDLATPAVIGAWLQAATASTPEPTAPAPWPAIAPRGPHDAHDLDLDGLARLPRLVDRLLRPDHPQELRHAIA